MRLNAFLAAHSQLSRRSADEAVGDGRVKINGRTAMVGQRVNDGDIVELDGRRISLIAAQSTTILLNKPAGYVVSRDGQGSKTIYDLLPSKYHHLKAAGRLDKDSSGVLVMSSDGHLINRLTHPRYQKDKIYEVKLQKPLTEKHQQYIKNGVPVNDYVSKLQLKSLSEDQKFWRVTMHEGHNRQIRRTFEALNNQVISLHRVQFGPYKLNSPPIKSGEYRILE